LCCGKISVFAYEVDDMGEIIFFKELSPRRADIPTTLDQVGAKRWC
jgi:hypothetical protein